MTPWQSTRGWRSRNCTVCGAEEIEWWGTDAKGEPVLHHDGPRCHRLCGRVRELEAEGAKVPRCPWHGVADGDHRGCCLETKEGIRP